MLEITNLTKRFKDHLVLDHISLNVPDGSIFGFIGSNGAGKTTTMKLILGLLKADEGEIKVNGEPVEFGQSKTNRNIGYLADVPQFYNYLNAKDYLSLCGRISDMPAKTIAARSDDLLNLVGLSTKKRIGSFSRGMKQRLGVASALLNRPKLLICDEPTSALDPVGRKEILDILNQIKGETTILFSTHILSDVERICDHVALLNHAHIVLDGELRELMEKHPLHSKTLHFSSPADKTSFLSLPDITMHYRITDESDTSITISTMNLESLLMEAFQ